MADVTKLYGAGFNPVVKSAEDTRTRHDESRSAVKQSNEYHPITTCAWVVASGCSTAGRPGNRVAAAVGGSTRHGKISPDWAIGWCAGLIDAPLQRFAAQLWRPGGDPSTGGWQQEPGVYCHAWFNLGRGIRLFWRSFSLPPWSAEQDVPDYSWTASRRGSVGEITASLVSD